jgi:hypothetical protein
MSPSSGNQLVYLLTIFMHYAKHQNHIRVITRNSVTGLPLMAQNSILDAYMQPGSDWRDVLILSGHVGWLLNLYAALRPKFSCEGYWLDCPIAVSARKLIVQFCSLTGTVFLSGITVSFSIFMLTMCIF